MSKGGKLPNSGRKPKGYIKRISLSLRIDPEASAILDSLSERIGNRSAAVDAMADYLATQGLIEAVQPMGENSPNKGNLISPVVNTPPTPPEPILPPSMAFKSSTLRVLDRLMERLGLDSHEAAVDAVFQFLRERDQLDGLIQAMARGEFE